MPNPDGSMMVIETEDDFEHGRRAGLREAIGACEMLKIDRREASPDVRMIHGNIALAQLQDRLRALLPDEPQQEPREPG